MAPKTQTPPQPTYEEMLADPNLIPSTPTSGDSNPTVPQDTVQAAPPDASLPSSVPSVVMSAVSAPPETQPALAPQGPKNPVLRFLSRTTGMTASTPGPGQMYEGPTTPEEKKAALGSYLHNLGNSLSEAAAPFGTPEQKTYAMELPEKQREVAAQQAMARAQLSSLAGYRQGELQNKATQNDIQRQKDIAAMRVKGYLPDESGAGYRSMTPEEVLGDPILSRSQEASQAAINAHQAQAALKTAQTDALTNLDSPTQQHKVFELNTKARQAEALMRATVERLGMQQQHLALEDYNTTMNTGYGPISGKFLGQLQAEGKAPQTLADANGNPVPYRQMSVFSPTMQMKNVAAQGSIAAQGIPNVIHEVDELKDSLGPVAGRWNEFMQGKVGTDNPAFAGLRADLLMLSSAVALAHARGRLPENLREEFDSMINAPQQDPENIKAVLGHILPWMQNVAKMPSQPVAVPPMTAPRGGGKPTTAPTAPSSVPSFADWKRQQGAQ